MEIFFQDFPFIHVIFQANERLRFPVQTCNNSSNRKSFSFSFRNIMQILFYYFPASQNIMSTLTRSMSPSSTVSISYGPSVSSQSDNISVGVSPSPTPGLPFTRRASTTTEVSSQGDAFSSSFSSFLAQNSSSLISKSSLFSAYVSGLPFVGKTRNVKNISHTSTLDSK